MRDHRIEGAPTSDITELVRKHEGTGLVRMPRRNRAERRAADKAERRAARYQGNTSAEGGDS